MRRPRFSLRTLLIGLTLCGIWCGLVAAKIADKRRQERFLATALQMAASDGAKVATYDLDKIPSLGARSVNVSLEGGTLSMGTAEALADSTWITNLTTGGKPPAMLAEALSSGFRRVDLPHHQFTLWERRMSLTDVVETVVLTASFLVLLCGVPVLLAYLPVTWTFQLLNKLLPLPKSLDKDQHILSHNGGQDDCHE